MLVLHSFLTEPHLPSLCSPGAADDAASVAILLELIRTFSRSFPSGAGSNALVFLFNEGEEEGLDGAHAFITKHRWRDNIRVAIDLEAMGSGGQHTLFQVSPQSISPLVYCGWEVQAGGVAGLLPPEYSACIN